MTVLYKLVLNSFNAYEFAIVLRNQGTRFHVDFQKILSTNGEVRNRICFDLTTFWEFSKVLKMRKIGTWRFGDNTVAIGGGGDIHIRSDEGFVFAIRANVQNLLHEALRNISAYLPEYYAASNTELPMEM